MSPSAQLLETTTVTFSFLSFLFIFLLFNHSTRHVGSQFPDQGLNQCSLLWKGRVSTIGLLGKFLYIIFSVCLSLSTWLLAVHVVKHTVFVFCYWIAAAKSLQSCPTLCSPVDSSPPGSPVPGILQARILEWVAISFSNA